MNKSFFNSAAYFFTCFGLLFSGVLLASIIKEHPIRSGDWATWIGSIGTVGTLIGTIYLATAETRNRKKQEMDLAILTAVKMTVRVIDNRSANGNLIMYLRQFDISQGKLPDFSWCADRLAQAPNWNMDEIIPLLPLKNNCAQYLAAASEQIGGQIRLFANLERRPGISRNLPELIHRVIESLEETNHGLTTALFEIERVTATIKKDV